MTTTSVSTSISFDRSSFIVDGQRRILLIGTINYFRLHPCDWEHRLRLFKDCGFNTVDVYVAWGFHEMSEGLIDFESPERDLDRYLRLCGDLGLWVYLRPGPYICNEFDGGGLPAWLYHKPGVEVRQNEPNYLALATRYLRHVNRIAARHQRTRGGPIILYAIENELDFYATRDVAGYMTVLRDSVRADGIDVPLAACIGQRTPIARAMGLIDNVIPTPNIYVNGEKVEEEATFAFRTLREARSLTGLSYDVPAFVTEMGRDENSLRRILSCGFKGLGPFNFAGGSNWDRFHAVNNWGDYKQLTTSIDFGGMIRFDGTIDQTYFDARRLARFVHCVEPEMAACEPAASLVKVEGDAVRAHCVSDGQTLFAFLANLGDEARQVVLQTPRGQVPRSGTLRVPPHKTPIITMGLPLARFGINTTIDYCTAEFWEISAIADGVRIELALRDEAVAELALEGGQAITVRCGDQTEMKCAGATIQLVGVDAHLAERSGISSQRKLGEAIDLAEQTWSIASPAAKPVTHEWKGPLRSLNELGVFHGAGEYETDVEITHAATSISIDYAADVVALWVDGDFHSTRLADGHPCRFEVPLSPGRHRLRLRATCWGRPCFHDDRWPAARLGSRRGLVGELRIDGVPMSAHWRAAADPIKMPEVVGATRDLTLNSCSIAGGNSLLATFRLERAHPLGAVLQMEAERIEALVYVERFGVGRVAFDEIYRFTGGPADRMLIPGELLSTQGSTLRLLLRGTQSSPGRVQRLLFQELATL